MEYQKPNDHKRTFSIGSRYWSEDKYEMFVVDRNETKGKIKLEVGLGMPAWYKLRVNALGRETVTAKGHTFETGY